MIRRIAGRRDCGECYRPFKVFEIVHYLGIDNNSFCAECREKLRPGEKDDPNDYGGWDMLDTDFKIVGGTAVPRFVIKVAGEDRDGSI